MQTIKTVAGLSVAVLIAACGHDKQPTANAALTRDLKAAADANLTLASQQAGARYAPSEIVPKATPRPATKLKREEEGPKVVESPSPTIAAAPEPTVAATVEIPQTQMVQTAQAATSSTEDALPAVSRPVPAVGGSGNMGVGDGDGSVYGGGPRVIIRGGGIGDDDHCEPPGGILINRPSPGATFPSGGRLPAGGTFPIGGGAVGRVGGGSIGGGVQRRGRGGL